MSRRQPGHAGLLRPALSDFFLCSQYLQRVLGVGPLGTGLLFLPIAVVIGVGTHLAVRAVGRFGGRPTATAGFALAAAGALLLSRLPGQGSAWTAVLPGLAVAGLGLGAGFVVATTTALAHVDPHDAGTTSGLVNTGHEIGAGLGIAYVSTLAAPSLSGTGAGVSPPPSPAPPSSPRRPGSSASSHR
jgi:hypothetical protein